jgi:Enoyl-CoA hydratase/carnithine racemase
MHEPPVLERTKDGITVLTLNEPERRNPLSPAVVQGLTEALNRLVDDDECRVVVLNGAGKGFCAGADLRRVREATIVSDRQDYRAISELNKLIWFYPKPTIAAVHGFAIGGGCNLMTWCDFSVVELGTRIGYPEVALGMPAGAVIPTLLRTVGRRATLEIALLGTEIDVARAAELGLISRAVEPGQAFPVAMEMAETLAARDPAAIAFTKETIAMVSDMDYERGISYARDLRVIARAAAEPRGQAPSPASSW